MSSLITFVNGPAGATGPQGLQGPAGANGADGQGLTNKGAWVTGSNYDAYDVVTDGGQTFLCILSITDSTAAPASDLTHFILWAEKGATGATGAAGPTGSAGTNGSDGAPGVAGANGRDAADYVIAPSGGDSADPVAGVAAAGTYASIRIKKATYSCSDDIHPLTGQRWIVEPGTIFAMASGKQIHFASVTDINILGQLKVTGDRNSDLIIFDTASARITGSFWINSTASAQIIYQGIVRVRGKYHNLSFFSSGDSIAPSATTNQEYYFNILDLYDSTVKVTVDGVTMSQADGGFYAVKITDTALRNTFYVAINGVVTTTNNTGNGVSFYNSSSTANNVIIGAIGGCDGTAYSDAGSRNNSAALKSY